MTEHGGVAPPSAGPSIDRLARWALRLGDREVLHLGCADAAQGREPDGPWVRWGECLTAVEMPDLVSLAAVAPRLVLHLGACQDPASSSPVLARGLLEHLGLGHRLTVQAGDASTRGSAPAPAEGDRGSRLPVSRRDLLPWLGRGRGAGAGTAGREREGRRAASADRRAPDPSAGHGEAGPQVRLAAALRELRRQETSVRGGAALGDPLPVPPTDREVTPGGDEASAAPRTGPGPSAHRLASAGCTGCQTCVRACPTSALELRAGAAADLSGDTSLTLVLERSACIGCLRCLSLCPVEALRDDGPVGWAELGSGPAQAVLEEVRVRPCGRCRTPFAGEGELCQVCRMRKGDPFGSWLPPGYVAPRVYAPPSPGPEGH